MNTKFNSFFASVSYSLMLFFLIATQNASAQNQDSVFIRKIYSEALSKGKCYTDLDFLCNKIGHRISGSPMAAAAVEYTKLKMLDYGFDTVWLQPVMVPRWERGAAESAFLINSITGSKIPLRILALGGSVNTPPQGVLANVIEVKSLAELAKLGSKNIAGKIVFFNRPMEPTNIQTFESYGGAVDQRSRGASEAAKFGAIGVLVRSMAINIDDYPHTGAMRYVDTLPKIPAGAISSLAAETLSDQLKQNPNVKVGMTLNCKTYPDVLSYNVIGEIRGSEFPNEVIAVGGHLDSWDVGQGAHDDGAGSMQSIEALRLFKALNFKPKRTLRAIMFMNEENGLKGGFEYAKAASLSSQKHIAALETDAGGFAPRGFGLDATPEKVEKVRDWLKLFEPYNIHQIRMGGGGADIGPLKAQGVPLIGLMPENQRYFDYHHTEIDTFDKVNKRELELGAATLSALMYLISEYGI